MGTVTLYRCAIS